MHGCEPAAPLAPPPRLARPGPCTHSLLHDVDNHRRGNHHLDELGEQPHEHGCGNHHVGEPALSRRGLARPDLPSPIGH